MRLTIRKLHEATGTRISEITRNDIQRAEKTGKAEDSSKISRRNKNAKDGDYGDDNFKLPKQNCVHQAVPEKGPTKKGETSPFP